MSKDFVTLVSQDNPAARGYQHAANNTGYPPSSSSPYGHPSPQVMDPFFLDDDLDDMPDTSSSRRGPMDSQASGIPLARAAAPLAGTGPSKTSLGEGVPQGWNFDDEEVQLPGGRPFNGSASFPGQSSGQQEQARKPSRRPRWKWPWKKEKVLTGERVIALNNEAANLDFCSNFVSTSKYNVATFVPKFLVGEVLVATPMF